MHNRVIQRLILYLKTEHFHFIRLHYYLQKVENLLERSRLRWSRRVIQNEKNKKMPNNRLHGVRASSYNTITCNPKCKVERKG